MISVVNWQTFQAVYMNNKVYVMENEDSWELWTSEGLFHIKCTVKKMEDDVENIMFVDRFLNNRNNIIKVIDVLREEDGEDKMEVPMNSDEAIREEELPSNETISELRERAKGMTSFDKDHYHFYEIENGQGKTISTNPKEHEFHTHQIIDSEVQEENGHIHLIADNILVEEEDGNGQQ